MNLSPYENTKLTDCLICHKESNQWLTLSNKKGTTLSLPFCPAHTGQMDSVQEMLFKEGLNEL